MGRNDGLLTQAEAAKLLGVSQRHLRNMARVGYIRPAKLQKRDGRPLYRPEDVHALVELRSRPLDLQSTASTAMQAHMLSRSIANKLDKLCRFLGLENNRLRTDEDSIYALHLRVQETLKEDHTELSAAAVIEWASIFNSFDEYYLQLLEDYTLSPSPWEIYLQLANDMAAAKSPDPNTNLGFAYACLNASRRNLRHVAYFYTATKRGVRDANRLFVDQDVTEEIIAQLYPRTLGPD